MPAWLISLIVTLVTKFGVPWVLQWLHDHFPWFPVSQNFKSIIESLVAELTKQGVSRAQVIDEHREKLKECFGAGCPMDLKGDM